MTKRDSELLAVSAVTYLALAIAFGVHAAFYLVIASAIVAAWIAACRRWPFAGHLTGAFLGGFIRGLVGGRRRRWR